MAIGSTLLKMMGLTENGGQTSEIHSFVSEAQDTTGTNIHKIAFDQNGKLMPSLSTIEEGIIKKLSDTFPVEELRKIFQEAKVFEGEIIETSSTISKDLTTILTKLFFEYIHQFLNTQGVAFKQNKKGLEKAIQGDMVLDYCLNVNYPKNKKVPFIESISSGKVTLENVPTDLFLVNYFQIIESILSSYCVNGIFAAIQCYKDFFDPVLVKKIQDFTEKYTTPASSDAKTPATVSLLLWTDTISLLEEIQKTAKEPFLSNIIELLSIYQVVSQYLIGNLNIAAKSQDKTFSMNSRISKTIFLLIGHSMKYIKSIQASTFGKTLNDLITKEIFGFPISIDDATKLAKYPLWTKIHTQEIPLNNKKILLSILYENRYLFIGKNEESGLPIFEKILSYAQDIGKLGQVSMLLSGKKNKKLSFSYYPLIFDLNLETQHHLHIPEILDLLGRLKSKGIDISNAHTVNNENWKIIIDASDIESAYIFFSEKKEHIDDYYRNLDFLYQIEDDVSYLPDFYPGKKLVVGLLQVSLFQKHGDFLQEKNKVYYRDYAPYGSPTDISSLNRELLFGLEKEQGLTILDSLYRTFYYLGKKPRRKILRQIFSQGWNIEDLSIGATIFSMLPQDFRYEFLLSNGKQFIEKAKENQIQTETNKDSVLGFVEMILADLKKSHLSTLTSSSESQTKNFSHLTSEQEQALRGKFPQREDIEELIDIINDTYGILNGMGNDFLNWLVETKHKSPVSVQHIEQIYDFFNFLHKKMHIPLVDRPEKVFSFLGTIEKEIFNERKNILYETYGLKGGYIPENYDTFKGTVLRFMKNGNIDILEGLGANEGDEESLSTNGYEHLFSEKDLKGIASRILPLTFREIKEKLKILGFTASEDGYNGGSHIRFSDGKKIITVPNHPGTIRLAVIDDKRRQLGLSIKQWNAL